MQIFTRAGSGARLHNIVSEARSSVFAGVLLIFQMTYLYRNIPADVNLYRNIVGTELQPRVLLSQCRFVVMDRARHLCG